MKALIVKKVVLEEKYQKETEVVWYFFGLPIFRLFIQKV